MQINVQIGGKPTDSAPDPHQFPKRAKRFSSFTFLATNASVLALGIGFDIRRNYVSGNVVPLRFGDLPEILALLIGLLIPILLIPSLIFQYSANRSHLNSTLVGFFVLANLLSGLGWSYLFLDSTDHSKGFLLMIHIASSYVFAIAAAAAVAIFGRSSN